MIYYYEERHSFMILEGMNVDLYKYIYEIKDKRLPVREVKLIISQVMYGLLCMHVSI